MHPSIYLSIWSLRETGAKSLLASYIASRSPATQSTTESLPPPPPPLVLSKMPETPATAVHPPNGSSKDSPSTILQHFGLISKKSAKAHRIFCVEFTEVCMGTGVCID